MLCVVAAPAGELWSSCWLYASKYMHPSICTRVYASEYMHPSICVPSPESARHGVMPSMPRRDGSTWLETRRGPSSRAKVTSVR